MATLVKKVSLSLPAPIQIDSTEPDVMKAALEQIPGRAIVNSVNLEAGRDKLDHVVPLCIEHGAALIALTIDEESMAKTRQRKVDVARRIHGYVCDEHGMDPQTLIFDALTFTLATGSDEFKDSAVETIEGIREIKAALPGVLTSLGVVKRLVRLRQGGARGAQQRLPAPLRRSRARPRDGPPRRHHAIQRDPATRARPRRRPRLQQARGRDAALHRALRGEGRVGRGGSRRPDRRDGAGGGAALPHPAAQEGRRRGLDRPQRREDRRRADAERRAAAGDEGGRRQVRRGRADPAVRAPDRPR